MICVVAASVIVDAQSDARSRYVGDDKCLSCHPKQKEFPRTAHHLTSQTASRESIKGSFAAGKNVLKTPEPALQYRLETRADGFYQTSVLGTPPDSVSTSQRFDLVIGSGRKGQTYLYWGNDQLFQLPVSYWTEIDSWVNSPGYGDRFPEFSRPVLPRCLECHASYIETIAEPNRFKKSSAVLGVTCERCHGPGAQHSTNPKSAIVNPAKLPRDRQLDLCSLCHGGVGVSKTPVFSFTVGDALTDHLQLASPKPDDALDVHGNQIELLQRSKCFKSSNMTCSTCHDVHAPQRNVADFSDRCLSCHKVQSCGLFPRRGRTLIGKCVDCHLPNQTSNVIFSTHAGTRLRPKVRNHWIKVYPGLSDR
ncbi:MAG TPA: multiheme c-type cytochrome [Pyrinomonadaceae bacterium]|nr:multiheme c-type cytochrome [Pyrinomonadaceae bacterium]